MGRFVSVWLLGLLAIGTMQNASAGIFIEDHLMSDANWNYLAAILNVNGTAGTIAGASSAGLQTSIAGNVVPARLQSTVFTANQFTGRATYVAEHGYQPDLLSPASIPISQISISVDVSSDLPLKLALGFWQSTGAFFVPFNVNGEGLSNFVHLETGSLSQANWYHMDVASFAVDTLRQPDFSSAGPALEFGIVVLQDVAFTDVSGSFGTNSVFDNFSVSYVASVPEPSSLAMVVFATGAVVTRRRAR